MYARCSFLPHSSSFYRLTPLPSKAQRGTMRIISSLYYNSCYIDGRERMCKVITVWVFVLFVLNTIHVINIGLRVTNESRLFCWKRPLFYWEAKKLRELLIFLEYSETLVRIRVNIRELRWVGKNFFCELIRVTSTNRS